MGFLLTLIGVLQQRLKYFIMMVSKITELTVFESPDGGRTIYARKSGSLKRELHYQDPKLQQELKELESQKRWVDIFQSRSNNTYAFSRSCRTSDT